MLAAFLAALVSIGMGAGDSPANDPDGQAESSEEQIVVEGIRDREKVLNQFVGALTQAPIGGQISRFDWAVCPAVVGISEAHRDAIAQRMRAVAQASGIKAAPVDCRPNVLVIVTGSKRDLIEQLNARMPAYFTGLTREQVRSLARDPGPVAAWHVEGLLNSDGLAVARDEVNDHYVVEMTDAPSRLKAASRPHFIAAVVVLELDSLAGMTPIQVADYAAMRTFARSDPRRLKNSSAWSILRIFDIPRDSPVPITMTEWDFNFLKALYSTDPNMYATQQRGSIRSQLRRNVDRPRPD